MSKLLSSLALAASLATFVSAATEETEKLVCKKKRVQIIFYNLTYHHHHLDSHTTLIYSFF